MAKDTLERSAPPVKEPSISEERSALIAECLDLSERVNRLAAFVRVATAAVQDGETASSSPRLLKQSLLLGLSAHLAQIQEWLSSGIGFSTPASPDMNSRPGEKPLPS